jgi:hypothetical protein
MFNSVSEIEWGTDRLRYWEGAVDKLRGGRRLGRNEVSLRARGGGDRSSIDEKGS